MTDVGKISLGVDLDASDLSAKLGEAVRRAIAPALERIQRDLNKTQHSYEQTGRAAADSADKQVKSLKAVERQAGQTAAAVKAAEASYGRSAAAEKAASSAGEAAARKRTGANDSLANSTRSVTAAQNEYNTAVEIFGKNSPQTLAAQKALDRAQARHTQELVRAAAASRLSTTAQIHDYERLARAAEESAAKQAAAAQVAAAARGGGGSGGGGSGGSRGGGGGVLGFLTGTAGLNVIAQGAAALPAVATGVVNIVGAVQQLAQAGLALPGIFAGGGAVLGTVLVGTKGIGDAVKALNKAMEDGDPTKIAEAKKAMEGLAPAAAEVASKLVVLTQGPLKDFQKAIAQPLLDGVADSIGSASDKVLPRAQAGMAKVAAALNGTIKTALAEVSSDNNLSLVDRIFGNTAEGQTRANAAIKPLLDAGLKLTAISSDFLPRLGDAITSVANRLDRFITRNADNGNLFRWIDEGLNGLRAFGNALLNIGKTVTGLTKAAGGDGGFLGWLERATKRMSDFVNSAEGQEKIGKFFAEGRERLEQWGDLLKELLPTIGRILDGFAKWGDAVFPVIEAIAHLLDTLGQVPGLIEAITVGLLAWRTIGGLSSLLGIGTLLGDLGKVDGKLGGIKGSLSRLNVAGALAGAAVTLDGVNTASKNGIGWGSAAESIAGGALAGGSVGGPIGALIGALTGLTLALNADRMYREDQVKKDAANTQRILDQSAKPLPTGVGNSILPRTAVDIEQAKKTALRDFNTRQNTYTDPLTGVSTSNPLPSNLQQQVDLGNNTAASRYARDALISTGQITAEDLDARIKRTQETLDKVNQLPEGSTSVAASGDIQINDPTPELLARVKELGLEITNLPGGKVIIDDKSIDEIATNVENLKKAIANIPGSANIVVQYTYNGQPISLDQLRTPIRVAATPGGTAPTVGGGRATGGPIWGGIRGVDSVPILAQHGEFVLDTGDVARMGGVAGVERFRRGLEAGAMGRFAEGGPVIGSAGTGFGPLPGPGGPETELGVLIQIRDLLGGKGGVASNPLAATAANTATTAAMTKDGTTGTTMGPFGTPIKARNRGYEAAAAAIQALGGDPEKFLGADPTTYVPPSLATTVPGLSGGTAAGASVDVAALQKFALSGNTADLPPGLTVNSPVVTAILGARNKKKGGLDDTAISDIVAQSLGPGGYSGTLDTNNTPLVKALEKLRTKGLPGTRGTALTTTAAAGLMTPLPGGALPTGAGLSGIDAAILSQIPSGTYTQEGAGDLTKGLVDCSSAVEDLVNIIDGKSTAGRTVSTGNEEAFLLANGFQLNTTGANIPGALNVGMNAGHTQATLPDGTNFNWGSEAAAKAGGLNGDGAFGAGLTKQFYRMVDGSMLHAGMAGGGLGAGGGTGTPVFVTNWPGQGGAGALGGIVGAGLGAAGTAAGNVAGDITGAFAGVGQEEWLKRAPDAELAKLIRERNPNALAAALGFNVQDFTRQGGAAEGDFQKNDGPAFDATGRVFSDTASLSDRTTTDLTAQIAAMREQLVDVITQVSKKLEESALEPVLKAGVQSALESLKDSVSAAIGTALGNAAAPPIADAVSSAVSSLPIDNSGAGGGNLANPAALAGALFADGGPVSGGTPGKDSVPAWLMPGEHVLDTRDVNRMGGQQGVYAFRKALDKGPIRKFATGGGVIANDTVGADFFGVSQVPIIGAIVNLLVRVLLQVIGVQIEARDTLQEMTGEFRQFRGDAFKAFDAQGRLLNDTSALLDRTQSSEQTVADERIRILKIVVEAIIKYIIEKVIVPITKAVANAAIQAGASAAGAAVNTQAPGAGGIVSSLISSAGQAGVEIAAEVGTDFALSISQTLISFVTEGLQSLFPDLLTSAFGGGLAEMVLGPIGDLLGNAFGGLFGLFGSLLGGLTLPGLGVFDQGGLAVGKGMLPKAVDDPELVLSPVETDVFTRFVSALESGGFGSNRSTTIHAPFTVVGGPEGAKQARDRLLALMP